MNRTEEDFLKIQIDVALANGFGHTLIRQKFFDFNKRAIYMDFWINPQYGVKANIISTREIIKQLVEKYPKNVKGYQSSKMIVGTKIKVSKFKLLYSNGDEVELTGGQIRDYAELGIKNYKNQSIIYQSDKDWYWWWSNRNTFL